MPFRSEAQRRFLWANHPEIARRWSAEYGSKIQPSSGQGQKHRASRDFELTPNERTRHTPFEATEKQPEGEDPVQGLPGSRPGPLIAVGKHKGLKRRDVRAAARAKLGKGR